MPIYNEKITTKYYEFSQNNSGGQFIGNYYKLYIEADSPEKANKIAQEKFNVYFDGCSMGIDCSCCGDRWYESSDWNEFDFDSYFENEPISIDDETPQLLIDVLVSESDNFDFNYLEKYGEESIREKRYWKMKCCVYTHDNQLIEFDGFGRIYTK